jgi:hypothetical protein
MAKGILSQRAYLFIVGVIFFALMTIRLLIPFNNRLIPSFTVVESQQAAADRNYSLYENIFGSHHAQNTIAAMSSSESISMKLVKSIPLSAAAGLFTMESSDLYKMEAIGKLKLDSSGSIAFEPVGGVHLTPLHANIGIGNLTVSTPAAHKSHPQIATMSAASNTQTSINQHAQKISPQHMKLVNPPSRQQDPLALLLVSPGEGTDIKREPRKLLEIYNQSRAIIPKLDLDHDFSVYFCKHLGHGVRFFYLARESLLLHPRIQIADNPQQAQYIIYLPVSSPWHKTECNLPSYRNKTIVLDEGDGPGLFEVNDNAGKWFLYFKRSFVSRQNGVFHGYMPYVSRGDIFPMTYTTAEAYIKLQYNNFINRDLEIVCTLRGSNHDPVRLRVREWIEEYVRARGIKNAVAGQINAASRTVISKEYFNNMYRARIIVTSNPSGWEGGQISVHISSLIISCTDHQVVDFRFCEALSSGALIFIDHMFVPRPNPFIDHQHIIYYGKLVQSCSLVDRLFYLCI